MPSPNPDPTHSSWQAQSFPQFQQQYDVCDTCRTLASNGQSGVSILPRCNLSLVNLPDEALYIRSPTVDPSLVVATLQVLKDWEKKTLREEKRVGVKRFLASENAARKCDLGVISYWQAGDCGKHGAEGQTHGTRVEAHDIMRSLELTTRSLGDIGDAAFSIAGIAAAGDGGAGHGGGTTHSGGGDNDGA